MPRQQLSLSSGRALVTSLAAMAVLAAANAALAQALEEVQVPDTPLVLAVLMGHSQSGSFPSKRR